MVKNISFYMILVLCISGLTCCDFAKKEAPAFVVVNVLDKKYHDDCHIKGSINVPFQDLEEYAKNNWDKDQTQVVLYCGNYKCTSSGAGAKALRALGFKYVWAYEGGIAEWLQKGLPTEGPCEAPFLKDYEAPADFDESDDIIITTKGLQKKIEEFGEKS